MNKILALIAVLVIGGVVAYTSIDWQSAAGNSEQANQQTSLKSGGSIQLTEKEAALTPSNGEKKVVLMNLGMY
jgi:hypothetical protein